MVKTRFISKSSRCLSYNYVLVVTRVKPRLLVQTESSVLPKDGARFFFLIRFIRVRDSERTPGVISSREKR
ncbi:hypothetical protein NDU88_003500 [Pleurodeles waltl]|uniref:Uncharacterized protein n=1 Tax=Pleurodeles waltl TaxID=8319 RepID=A0AAV7WRU4_PLEWA|nr:hypothetical protein NDU88_003500 [Pleurodeles waltl]